MEQLLFGVELDRLAVNTMSLILGIAKLLQHKAVSNSGVYTRLPISSNCNTFAYIRAYTHESESQPTSK